MEIGSAALRGFGAEIVEKSFYCIFPVRLGDLPLLSCKVA